jgi:DNA-binding NtrC family response regulator
VKPHAGDKQTPCIEFSKNLPTIEQLKTYLVDEALCRARGNRTDAAAMLGISRQALIRKLNINKNNDYELKGDTP